MGGQGTAQPYHQWGASRLRKPLLTRVGRVSLLTADFVLSHGGQGTAQPYHQWGASRLRKPLLTRVGRVSPLTADFLLK